MLGGGNVAGPSGLELQAVIQSIADFKNEIFAGEVTTPIETHDGRVLTIQDGEQILACKPLTVIVKPGILAITQGDTVRNAALHAGFVQILPQEITILAEIIEWPGEIDEARANAAKQRAEGRLAERGGSVDVARAEAALMRSIARIDVAKLK